MDHHPRAPQGARTLVLAQLSKATVLLLGIVVLSRVLAPEQFGFVAVPLTIVGIGEVIRDLGLSTAATTTPKLTTELRDLLFWLNCAIALALTVVTVAVSPLVGLLFDSEEAARALPWLSLVFVLNGLGAQYRADLNRAMRFRAMALVDSLSPFAGVVAAIFFAVAGAGYWALVIQPIAAAVVSTVLVISLCRWAPGRPRRVKGAWKVIAFGMNVAWSQSIMYIGNNIDTFALGYWATPTQLGYYTRAFQVAVQPLTLLKSPATSVALPMLARRRDNPAAFQSAVVVGQRLIGYTILPVAVIVASCAAPLVLVFLGPEWSPMIPLVALLALGAAFQQMASVASWMLLAANAGQTLSAYSMVSLGIKAVAILLAAPYGPLAVAFAYLASAAVAAPIVYIWAAVRTGVNLRVLSRGLMWPAATAVAAGGTAYAVSDLTRAGTPALQLCAAIVAFCTVYALASLVPAVRRDVREVVSVLTRRGDPPDQ